MKEIECNIIKDLLPNYIDKTTSEVTNKLIEKHLNSCNECMNILEEMNKDLDNQEIFNQDKKIDYLKGYRKNKVKSIIVAILSTIIVLLIVLCVLVIFDKKIDFFVDINKLEVYLDDENSKEDSLLVFQITNHRLDLRFYEQYETVENKDDKSIYIKTVGKATFGKSSRTYLSVDIDKNTDKIFLEDQNGNVREIWCRNLTE